MKRTDTHAPSTFEPAEYEEVGSFDNHHEDGYCDIESGYADKYGFEGNYERRGRCDHCGAGPLRYGVIFYHAKSDALVVVGLRCAHKLGLSSRTELDIRRQGEAAKRRRMVAEFIAASDDNRRAHEFLTDQLDAGNHGYGGFYFDLLHKLNRYGSLSEKQVAAVLKSEAREAEFQAKRDADNAILAEAGPLEEGRREITGTIVSARFQESDFGSTPKMLVKQDDGNKVWLTIPDAAFNTGEPHPHDIRHIDNFKGCRITITATVERSRDDEHFGFGKRPTKATVEEVSGS